MAWLMWLRHILFLWVRERKVGVENLSSVDWQKPVVYVLHSQSLSDLLVLDKVCVERGMMRPMTHQPKLAKIRKYSYLFMAKLGLLQLIKNDHRAQKMIAKVCEQEREHSLDIQLVPVSVIWGRNVPKEEDNSYLKLIFTDNEYAGMLQKFFIILAQGRETLIHFGEPVSMRKQVELHPDSQNLARKLYRVFRVHFRTQRQAILGPKAYDRYQVISEIFSSPVIAQAIDDEAKRKNLSQEAARRRVAKYLKEIAAIPTQGVVRFLYLVLSYVWNRIYRGMDVAENPHLLRYAKDHEIIYVPAHRSHLDYLVMPYHLYERGLKPPHFAAGINLSFWPVGPLLRRAGAFFLRRSFKGERLYKTVFVEYLKYLMSKGHAFTFYLEGGRSRTGKLLKPKTGMLSMVVQNFLDRPQKPVVFIPVYIGYDRVAEVKSYLSELGGKPKVRENFWAFLQARKILKQNHGKVYIGFGNGLFLESWLNNHRKSIVQNEANSAVVTELANDLMKSINSSVVLSPVALVATALLSSPKRAIVEFDLRNFLEIAVSYAKGSPFVLRDATGDDPLKMALELAPLKIFSGIKPIVHLEEREANILKYYRNNIQHVFIAIAIISSFYRYSDQLAKSKILADTRFILKLLCPMYFVDSESFNLENEVQFLNRNGLLKEVESGLLQRPSITSKEYAVLQLFGHIFSVENLAYIVLAVTKAGQRESHFQLSDVEGECLQIIETLALLSSDRCVESMPKSELQDLFQILVRQGYIVQHEGKFRCSESMSALVAATEMLIPNDVKTNILESQS